MGIPHLRQLLEPYAEQADLNGRDLVIDGPALAYHIFYQCQPKPNNLFQFPSYRVLAQTAIRFLDDLVKSGAHISAIYFDGYLPSAKESERKRRHVDLTNGIRSYSSLYPSSVPARGNTHAQAKKNRATSSAAGSGKRLPAPPFLVPAILEALCVSETYSPVTQLVPGEADIFCARKVASTRGIVITSDSDLLVHDLGHHGSVAFFATIEFKMHAGTQNATVAEYCIQRVCERLAIPLNNGISSLAFEVISDPHITLKQAIQQAKRRASSETSTSEYTDFMAQYLCPEIVDYTSLHPISGHLLDPRISELVLKLRLSDLPDTAGIAKSCTIQAGAGGLDVPMYLPFLVDSLAQTSAWETSTTLRGIAYGIGRSLTSKSISSIVEYRRLQSLTGGTRVDLPPPSGLAELCAKVVDCMAKIRACLTDPGLKWIALAVYQDIVASQTRGKSSILSLDMLQAEARGTLNIGSWDFVHLHAQVQGTYYSLRMVEHVCDFISRDRVLPDFVSKLQRDIGHISILDIPSISDFAGIFAKLRVGVDLPKLVTSLELGAEVSDQVQSILAPGQNRKRKKRSEREGAEKRSTNLTQRSNNPFDLLEESG